jgi:RNA polymerase sigma-70 factor (TIGR02943 family)
MTDLAEQVQALRPQLMRFARAQLRNDALAEDAVSETVLAALERPQAFAGQSQLKTWLIGILKHKVVDQLRRATREVASSDEETGDLSDDLFDDTGHWRSPPADWGNPEASLGRSQFFQVLELCIDKLPGKLGRVFMMREWLELETDEICKELQITPTNLWVMLHRARLRLRECLEITWFAEAGR